VWEAAALASHYKVDNLYAIVDVNGQGQSQRTMYGFDVGRFASIFRAFGWYAVTVDGHDCEAISAAFAQCRAEGGDRPRAILARTHKGRGVSLMEDRDDWHGKPIPRKSLDAALAELAEPYASNGFKATPRPDVPAAPRPASHAVTVDRAPGSEVATREAYGDALAKLVAADPQVVALDGDTKNSTFSQKVLASHAGNFFEMFIAEQNMVGVAAGMSACGKIPFVSTFAAFLTRAFDQVRMARISGVNVRLVGSHCGVSIGPDGPSQMGLEDMAMFRAIPDSVVLYPSDGVSTEHLVARMADHHGISYLRTSRPKTPVIYANDDTFHIGGSKVLRQTDQDRVTLVAAGITVHEAIKAADALEEEGIRVRVIDAYSVKPIDRDTLLDAAAETGCLVVVEDHYPEGGLGDATMEAVGNRAPVLKVAVRGVPRSGNPDQLLHAYGIDASGIVEQVRNAVVRVAG
jgi:transketolase